MTGTMDTKTVDVKLSTIDYVFGNADSFPLEVFTPPSGKRIIIHDLVVGVLNTSATQPIIIIVQAYIGGAWQNIFPVAVPAASAKTLTHNFGGRVQTGMDGGIRLIKSGTSTSFSGVITATGRVE